MKIQLALTRASASMAGLVTDRPGQAAVACLVLRQMGFADLKVWAP